MSNTDTRKTHDTSNAENGRVGSSDSSALWSEIYRLRAELNTIRDYDRDSKHGEGICPYGCDCPSIADKALRESLEWENLMNYEPTSRSATQLHKDSATLRMILDIANPPLPNVQSEPRPGDALTQQSKQENTK